MVKRRFEGALQSTVILLEGNIEKDQLKGLRMNFLILQYCKESAVVILEPWCAIKLVEEQNRRNRPEIPAGRQADR